MQINPEVVFQGVVLLVVGWAGNAVRSMAKDFRSLGHRTTSLEVWREGHEKLNDERHNENLTTLRGMQDALEQVFSLERRRRADVKKEGGA